MARKPYQVATWHPLREDAWLSGFVAGEGNFHIQHHRKREDYYTPQLRIALRDDDGEILHELREAFGGSVQLNHLNKCASQRGFDAKPQVRWAVSGKVDLLRMCDYLDRFPLRAKKAREYPIWRAAVHIYVEEGGRSSRLATAKTVLEATRVYAAPARRLPLVMTTQGDSGF